MLSKIINHIAKMLFLLVVGGSIYYSIEILWRGHSHWSMFLLGGVCFILIGLINEIYHYGLPMWYQILLGDLIVTMLELIAGYILNIVLGMNIWDYTSMPLNIMGQVCVPYMILWLPLVLIAILLDDYTRYWMFKEDKPQYNWGFKWRDD